MDFVLDKSPELAWSVCREPFSPSTAASCAHLLRERAMSPSSKCCSHTVPLYFLWAPAFCVAAFASLRSPMQKAQFSLFLLLQYWASMLVWWILVVCSHLLTYILRFIWFCCKYCSCVLGFAILSFLLWYGYLERSMTYACNYCCLARVLV